MATLSTSRKIRTKGKDKRFFARISSVDKKSHKETKVVSGLRDTNTITQAHKNAIQLVKKHCVIQLNRAESRHLMEALMSPPLPTTKRIKLALKRYRESVVSDVNPTAHTL